MTANDTIILFFFACTWIVIAWNWIWRVINSEHNFGSVCILQNLRVQQSKRIKKLEETVEVLEASMVERDKDTLEKRRQGRTMYG